MKKKWDLLLENKLYQEIGKQLRKGSDFLSIIKQRNFCLEFSRFGNYYKVMLFFPGVSGCTVSAATPSADQTCWVRLQITWAKSFQMRAMRPTSREHVL